MNSYTKIIFLESNMSHAFAIFGGGMLEVDTTWRGAPTCAPDLKKPRMSALFQ